jgi:hypothetical protein
MISYLHFKEPYTKTEIFKIKQIPKVGDELILPHDDNHYIINRITRTFSLIKDNIIATKCIY